MADGEIPRRAAASVRLGEVPRVTKISRSRESGIEEGMVISFLKECFKKF
jgi:hypothetical protein